MDKIIRTMQGNEAAKVLKEAFNFAKSFQERMFLDKHVDLEKLKVVNQLYEQLLSATVRPMFAGKSDVGLQLVEA